MTIFRILLVMFLAVGIFFVNVGALPSPKTINTQQRRASSSSPRDLVKAYNRAKTSAKVFKSIMEGPKEYSFSQPLLEMAQAIAVFPAKLKYSSLTGHKGSGIVSTRDAKTGFWLPPIFINISGKSIDQYLGGSNDLILFALNTDSMQNFFTPNFKLQRVLPSQECLSLEHIDNVPILFNFVAYSHNEESLSIINIENSTIKHNGAINFAVYGERQLKPFLPTSKQIPNRVLVFPQMLNSYIRKL